MVDFRFVWAYYDLVLACVYTESEVIIMMMVDTDILQLIDNNVLYGHDISEDEMRNAVGAISYDLHTLNYTNNETVASDSCKLLPGESVFVACKEIVNLPGDISASIILRNSRIRQGFMLDAPVYQPGHHTRVFYRITNVSKCALDLRPDSDFASIQFEKLDHAPSKPYNGAFQGEMGYSDMGKYTSQYKKEMSRLDEKMDEIKHLERNIYTNIITLMSIFIALFSIININVDLAFAPTVERSRLLISNLVTIGSIAFLVSLIQLCFARKGKRGIWIAILILAIAILAGVALFAL